jgi:8-amino-7-oxononanoate synthase
VAAAVTPHHHKNNFIKEAAISRFFYFSTKFNELTAQEYLQQKLQARYQSSAYRQLSPENDLTDFCSNDYLGFARSAILTNYISEELSKYPLALNGSTGSRLLAGNTHYTESLEQQIAAYHGAQSGLLFNSGYDANLGLLSSIPQRGDTVIHDELAHASIIDGIRLSHAKRYSFKHNNLDDLAQKLKNMQGVCYVVVESVYSMDGDLAPLLPIAQLVASYNASLIVDEAHALGVLGRGLVNLLALEDKVFARVITFGKALGCHGAIILGSNELRQYLINFARSFIYTTAAPFHQNVSIKMGYQFLEQSSAIIADLKFNIELYNNLMEHYDAFLNSSAIKTIIIGGNERTTSVALSLQKHGYDVRAILSPTVAAGSERLRICLHAYNTADEIAGLTDQIKNYLHGQ